MTLKEVGMQHEVKIETVKTIPAVIGAFIYGITLQDLVAFATLIYILIQIAYLIWKWRHERKTGKISKE